MKNILPQQFDSFFQSMETNKQVIYTEKFGLFDATLTMMATSDMNISELFIYNNEAILLSSHKFKKEENDKHESILFKMNQLVRNLCLNKNEKKSAESKTKKLKFLEDSSFIKISYPTKKIYFLNKSNLIFVGIFDVNSKGDLIKLYLLHIYSAFVNFLGDNIDMIVKNKKREEYGPVTLTGVDGTISYFSRDFLQIKIFEKKNYVKIRKNEKLWQEIIHHSKFILKQYKSENKNKFDLTNSNYNFVKFECISTYPRLLFVIKFLPILNGISIIHVLSQNKLSRKISDDELSLYRGYREIDIINGRDFIENHELDILYPEPKKLREIEKFLIEFYISTVNKENLFHSLSHELKYFDYYLLSVIDETANLYINNSLETIIRKILKKLYEVYLNGIESENERVTTQNHNMNNIIYTNTQNNIISSANVQYIYNNDANSISIDKNYLYKDYKESNSDIGINLNLNTNYMNINREFVLKCIFHLAQSQLENQSDLFNLSNLNLNNTKNDNTLFLSRIEETQSKMNLNENEQSFQLNFTDLSGIDNINDEEGMNNANIILTSTNNKNLVNNPIQNPVNNFLANPLNKIKRNKDLVDNKTYLTPNVNVSNAPNDSFVKSNLSFFFNNKNNQKKMRQSYSNLNNKISPTVLKIMNFDASDITDNREVHKKSGNSTTNHINNATDNNINDAIDNAVKNLYNSQSFGYNSSLEKKRENYRKIPFNEKHIHSFSMDLDLKNYEEHSDNMKKIELFQSFDNLKEKNLEINEHGVIKDNISGNFEGNNFEDGHFPNFIPTHPVGNKSDIRQSAPTFRGSVPENNKIT